MHKGLRGERRRAYGLKAPLLYLTVELTALAAGTYVINTIIMTLLGKSFGIWIAVIVSLGVIYFVITSSLKRFLRAVERQGPRFRPNE